MSPLAQSSITEMLNCFGQTSQNYEVFLATLGRLCDGLTDQAIIEAADRFSSGEVPSQSKKFPPSGPEFVEEARRRQEFIDLRNRPHLARPASLNLSGGVAPFQVRVQQARSANAHRPVLLEDVNFEKWQQLSREKQFPPGSSWVACLATVFGPETKAHNGQEQ